MLVNQRVIQESRSNSLAKKSYKSPKLKKFGKVAQLTLQPGSGGGGHE